MIKTERIDNQAVLIVINKCFFTELMNVDTNQSATELKANSYAD